MSRRQAHVDLFQNLKKYGVYASLIRVVTVKGHTKIVFAACIDHISKVILFLPRPQVRSLNPQPKIQFPKSNTCPQLILYQYLFCINIIIMQNTMRVLYHQLWGNPVPTIQQFMLQVPLSNYGIHPGYKIPMRSSARRTFAPPKFETKKEVQLFQMVEVEGKLPCGV